MPESRAFLCPLCGRPATSEVRGLVTWDGYDESGQAINPPCEWGLLQCNRCWEPCVQLREDYGRGFVNDEPAIYYPSPHRISSSVPQALQREWGEAQACFDAKAYTACLVMVRRTLEGVSKDQGVAKRTLNENLKELKARGLMDGMLAEWADALRVAGNKGAHFTGEAVSRQDAEDALAFAEALLDHIYVLRQRFTEFVTRISPARHAP